MFLRRFVPLLLVLGTAHAAEPALDIFNRENIAAWCIVPYDAKKRGPEERAQMLKELGITKLAYDWRTEHIPTFDAEVDAMKANGIEIIAWWYGGKNQPILDTIKRKGIHPQLWVAGSRAIKVEEFAQRVEAEAARIRPIAQDAAALGCKVGLYNHREPWIEEQDHQIAVIEKLRAEGIKNVGIVLNFHHWRGSLAEFPALFKRMQPYLYAVNLNGMMADTSNYPAVRYVGTDASELQMMKVVAESGWRGPVGIINEHTDLDAKDVLAANLTGVEWVVKELKQPGSGGPKPIDPNAKPAPAPAPKPTGGASLSPDFGSALTGGLIAEGKAEYRALPITVECRARLDSAKAFNILVASDAKKSAEHWELYSYAGSGQFAVYQPGRGGNVQSGVNICDGQWHALAAVLEPDRVRLFVDGKLVKDAPAKPLSGSPAPGSLAIGRLVEGGLGCDGAIDDVRISKGVRDIGAPGSKPLARDAQTLELFDFNDLKPALKPMSQAEAPESFTIPAAKKEELTKANGWPAMESFKKWERSLGGPTSNRFSALTQIDKTNVAKLEPAWTFHSGDGKANIQCNPIVVGRTMYVPTAGWSIAALDAATGKEVWRFTPAKEGKRLEDQPARRGLLYWAGDAQNAERVIFGAGNWIYALDPKTGKVLEAFGEKGRTIIPAGTSTVGAVWGHFLVAAGYAGDVFGYDIRSGKLLWTFKTKPEGSDYGAETWSNLEQGANCWGGMALDESRGIAYVATGSPKPNYLGMGHTGDNLFSNCVLAIDVLTGKRLWHFQEIRHDVWDWDIPAPPNLVTVERDGLKVDAVAQVTKLGNTLLLDRVTGQPLYDFKLVRTNNRVLPGDIPAPMQPMPELPQPFARQGYTEKDLPTAPEKQAVVMPVFQRSNHGPYPSIDEAKPTLIFNVHGGAEWTGAAFDPTSGHLFVTANEIPWFVTCFRDDDPEPLKPPTEGEKVYQSICFACHGPDRKGIGHAPPLRGVRHRLKEEEIRAQIKNGKGSMPPMPQLTEEQIKPLIDFLLCRDRPIPPFDPKAPVKWTFGGWNRLVDAEGYPGCTGPWGTLTSIDLNTGKIAWQVPFGEYPELTAKGVPKTGQENFAGCMVTASGLVFAGGTRDKKIRAFDAATGAELWSYQLPLHVTAPPASYEVDGRQYIVVPVTGGGKLGGETGDMWTAFALPAAK